MIVQDSSIPVDSLPDFRNLGVIARILVYVNIAALLAAVLASDSAAQLIPTMLRMVVLVEPVLVGSVVVLYLANNWLAEFRYETGTIVVAGIVAAIAAIAYGLLEHAGFSMSAFGLARVVLLATLFALVLGEYFRLRNRALSPAFSEARLQALQARIRPHFLFNSMNAILSLIRTDPRRAERAIEDLAELFRTLMSDNRKLVPLENELQLVRDYLSVEQLRLGSRLAINWLIDGEPERAQVPPLFLQPLVENAVYHGVEPGRGRGTIEIQIVRSGDRLRMRLSNPYHPTHQHRQGNRMALANIRERLALHFDVEASLTAGAAGDRYEIAIELPYRTVD